MHGTCQICRAVTDTPIAWVNHAFERNTGYASAEVVGRNPRFMHGAEIAQPALEEIRRALRDSSPVVATVRNFRKDGSLFYNQVSIAPVCDDDCAGLCAECGQRWDDLPDDHTHEQLDPRWAGLAGRFTAAPGTPGADNPEEN